MGGDGIETVEASDVATNISSITSYGSQIAKVFHNHVLIAARIPVGFEGSINILDATIATLNQLLALLWDEAGSPKKLFSREGLTYVNTLAKESATNLALITLAITKASSIDHKNPKSGRNKWKKTMLISSEKKAMAATALEPVELDEQEFLSKVENAKWNQIQLDIDGCTERLYELQLHLLLVFQVVTIGGLSKDVSSGKVDIQGIVTFHERVKRTADLLGIGPKSPSKPKYDRQCPIIVLDSDSDGDVSTSSVGSRPRPIRGLPPPPPPGFRQTPVGPGYRPFGCPPPPPLPPPTSTVPGSTKPPSYAESRSPEAAGSSVNSTLLGTVTSTTAPGSQVGMSAESGFRDEKADSRKVINSSKEEKLETKEETKAVVSDARLFKTHSSGFGFKIKSFFRSKSSLAEEMKRALNDAESTLSAFIINEDCLSQVPHSAFHSLEWTHMRTILSQLNDNTWYKTFSELTPTEVTTMSRITNQRYNTKIYRRDVVVLKVLQQNRWNAWMRLLTSEGLSSSDDVFPHHINGRIILAIVREKLSDKCPPVHSQLAPVTLPPPPPHPPSGLVNRSHPAPSGVHGPQRKGIRPPILPSYVRPSGISDLALPAPPPPPPSYPPPIPSRTPPPVFPALPGKKTMDMTPITEHDALVAMTTYNEYTFRLAPQSLDNSVPRSWRCVSITQEATDHAAIVQHLVTAEHRGCNVMTSKLRLNQDQDAQVTRLMDELQKGERDNRFNWTWAEISLFDEAGEYIDLGFIRRGPAGERAAKMHLIAKRMPKRECKAQDLYEQLMKNPGAPPPGPTIYVPPYPPHPPPHPPPVFQPKIVKRGRSSSDSYSYYDSSDSEASVGIVRSKLRKFQRERARRLRKSALKDSDSDSGSDTEKEDVIKIQVDIKRSDEVVKKLLELWTPEEGKGKGKEIA